MSKCVYPWFSVEDETSEDEEDEDIEEAEPVSATLVHLYYRL